MKTFTLLFSDIFINRDILGGCGESGIKIYVQILKWVPALFRQIVKSNFTHMYVYGDVCIGRLTLYAAKVLL